MRLREEVAVGQMHEPDAEERALVARALSDPIESVRLRAALRAGSAPAPDYIDPLIERCAVEPDFFVRDMLTWALIQQHDSRQVTAQLLPELGSTVAQARAQALHTLSKIGDPGVWPAITSELLADPDDEIARTAWRAAAGLVPDDSKEWLAEQLATQWGRGGRDVRLSLTQALLSLGDAALPVVERAMGSDDYETRWHALATKRIIDDPELAFDSALKDANRVAALRGAPMMEQ